MPIYEYECSKCGRRFEELVSAGGEAPACPHCGDKNPTRLLSSCKSKSKGGAPLKSFAPMGGGCGSGGFS